jgi:hypothetical protein
MNFSRHHLCCFTVVPLFVLDKSMADNMTPPTSVWGVSDPGGAALPRNFCPHPNFFQTHPKTDARPARKQKKLCSCILEGRLTTNPILSALHLQGLKSNIYIYTQYGICSQAAFKNARAKFFCFRADGHLFSGRFEKSLGGGKNFAARLSPPGSDTPHTLVGGVISSA